MKKVVVILLIIFIILFVIIYNISINKNIVSLYKCVDGDTAWFKINGEIKKYRFLAIDSPEVDKKFGKESSEYTCNILSSAKQIRLEYDMVGETKDKYDRELVWVYVDGVLLQEKLLEGGFAKIKYIYANYDYLEKLFIMENYAKNNRSGIWKDYSYKEYNDYYNVTFDNINVKVLKNSVVDLIENPYKDGCRFIGWTNGNYLFDLSTKVNKDYNLKAKFEC